MKILLFSGALVATAMSLPAFAQAMSASEYVTAAGAGDLYERQSSEIVLASTKNPELRSFAAMMIKHHTKSTADVKAATMKAKLKPKPARLTPAQSEMIAQLSVEKDTARDAAYIAQQKAAHGQALTVHKAYAEGGMSPPLKATAAAIVPVIKMHIATLMKM